MQVKKNSKLKRKLFISFIVSCLITLLSYTGLLDNIDRNMADNLYQNDNGVNEEIFVIGVDSYALSEFGEWPWNRDIMADVVNILNSDEENRPAAIGIDVLYVTDGDATVDEYLAQSLSADNVVVASGVEFETSLLFSDDGTPYIENFAIVGYNMPFQNLRESTTYGHINAMYDTDGVLRHHLWSVQDENGDVILSFPYQLYLKYCEANGLEVSFSPSLSKLGYWWVDYSSSPGGFYACSVADIIYGDYDPTIFKDAILIIGPYDSSLSDEYITPIDHAKNMFGVEYLANVTNAMVLDITKYEVLSNAQTMALFFSTFICTMIIVSFSMRISWLVSVILSLCTLLCSVTAYKTFDVVFMPLLPMVATGFGLIGSIVSHYIVETREKERISQTFGRYVDPKVMKELMSEGEHTLDLGGKNIDIAVLFVDIRGFTELAEKLEPEQVVGILNEFLTLTSDCIKKNQGTLDKFIGDCTMAFWGAPRKCKNPIYLACKTAMDMADGAKPLEERLLKNYGYSISFGIGVHYGPAVVGNIGAVDRMDYTAIGDTVNTASRLEANAPSDTVYISRVVADALGDLATTKLLDLPIKLKGKEDDFEILTLESLTIINDD